MKGPTMGRTLSGKRVLELGCGHGLPGIVALINGAEVHFQASMTSPKPVSGSSVCHCHPVQDCFRSSNVVMHLWE